MKIAIIAHSHYPIKEPFAGGLEAHTFNLAKMLISEGHEVTLYAAKGSDKSLNVVSFCHPTAGEQFEDNKLLKEYRANSYKTVVKDIISKDYDIVHNNSLHYVPLLQAEKIDIPVVTSLHTPPIESMLYGMKKAVRSRNHTTIAVSKFVANLWLSKCKGISPHVIHNGIDTSTWVPYYNKKRDRYAVWSGRITDEKGTHYAIMASIKARINLKICGPIYNENYYNTEIKPLINNSKTIQYLGPLSTNQLQSVVRKASVSICTPCWDEPFGLVVSEALASGIPVAGFDRGALSEILTNSTGVLVDKDTTLLSKAILQAEKLSQESSRNRGETFSVNTMIEKYTKHYKMVYNYRKSIDEVLYG